MSGGEQGAIEEVSTKVKQLVDPLRKFWCEVFETKGDQNGPKLKFFKSCEKSLPGTFLINQLEIRAA